MGGRNFWFIFLNVGPGIHGAKNGAVELSVANENIRRVIII